MSRMRSGMIDMESNTTLVQCYPAHEAVPDGDGPFPAVLLLHDKFGLSPNLRGVANRLARQGFYVLTPNLYAHPTSFADVAADVLRMPVVSSIDCADVYTADELASGLTDERADGIVTQALAYTAGRSKARSGGVGVLGFSMGGRLALLAACSHPDEVRACVAVTPEGLGEALDPRHPAALSGVESLRAPLLLLYGAFDREVNAAEREAARVRLSALGKEFTIEVFPEAPHDFFFSDRETYRIKASKIAWEKTLALFRSTLPGQPNRLS